jgi:signal transduction histidine kinase
MLRAACEEAIDAGRDQAQLIDALLTLARSQRGLDERESVDLTGVVNEVLGALGPPAAARGLEIDSTLDHVHVSGDAHLLFRLVSNLVDNAIRYNVPRGRVEVGLAAGATQTTLTVANTGPQVAEVDAGGLLEPFKRAAPDRTASPHGLGLGLSIVAEIAAAHDAVLDLRPRPEGGLSIRVSFPGRSADAERGRLAPGSRERASG